MLRAECLGDEVGIAELVPLLFADILEADREGNGCRCRTAGARIHDLGGDLVGHLLHEVGEIVEIATPKTIADGQQILVRSYLLWQVDPNGDGPLQFFKSYGAIGKANDDLRDSLSSAIGAMGEYQLSVLLGAENRLDEAEQAYSDGNNVYIRFRSPTETVNSYALLAKPRQALPGGALPHWT